MINGGIVGGLYGKGGGSVSNSEIDARIAEWARTGRDIPTRPRRGRTKYFYRNGQTERVVTGALGTGFNLGTTAADANFVIPWNTVADEDLYPENPDFTVSFPAGINADLQPTRTNGFISPEAGTYDFYVTVLTEQSTDTRIQTLVRKVMTNTDDQVLPMAMGYVSAHLNTGHAAQGIIKDLVLEDGDVFYISVLNIDGTDGVQGYFSLERIK